MLGSSDENSLLSASVEYILKRISLSATAMGERCVVLSCVVL
jgi:hypothetical protein